ncbi:MULTISPECIES: ribosome biogenesis factor YjgA [Oceanisphaera]|uniref:Dual-action ribosomal maturation protein DarP n=1 Tax=Oceanisphaera ostreae TaxID=914151 RepID=A0ABW3KE69_9GAMM
MRHHNDAPEKDEEIEWVSKSEMKRESHALRKLGETLVKLQPHELAKVPLEDDLKEAIELAHRLHNKREGLRRHMSYLGRLIRTRDITDIQKALAGFEHKSTASNAKFHKLELWRDRLIKEGDKGVNALLSEHRQLDRQKLRQLARIGRKELAADLPPVAYRELFQYLKTNIGEEEK